MRKQWLATKFDPDLCVNHNIKTLRYRDFVDKELIHFCNYDNLRSIPCLCDGLKVILFCNSDYILHF